MWARCSSSVSFVRFHSFIVALLFRHHRSVFTVRYFACFTGAHFHHLWNVEHTDKRKLYESDIDGKKEEEEKRRATKTNDEWFYYCRCFVIFANLYKIHTVFFLWWSASSEEIYISHFYVLFPLLKMIENENARKCGWKWSRIAWARRRFFFSVIYSTDKWPNPHIFTIPLFHSFFFRLPYFTKWSNSNKMW